MKKFLSIMLTVLMVVTMIPFTPVAFAAETADDITVTIDTGASVTLKDTDGDGYYEIGTANELYAFAGAVNGGNAAVNGELTADITVNKNVLTADGELNGDGSGFRKWTPIGTSSDGCNYSGIFDGAKHEISGLYVNTGHGDNVGLFGYVGAEGTVSNVGIIDSYFYAPIYVGGVVGQLVGGTIQGCYNTGTISAKIYNCGGVVGYIKDGIVLDCYNTGSVSGEENIGGVVGHFDKGSMQNCYNTGSVYGPDNYVGGVAGFKRNAAIVTNCYYLSGCAKNAIGSQMYGFGYYETWVNEDEAGVTTAKSADWFSSKELCAAIGYHHGPDVANGFCDFGDYESAVLNADGYYEIGNAGQLFWFANYINTVDRTANAVLTADIDLENRPWTPIGSTGENNNNFRGIFDGQNHTIEGLYVEGGRAGLGFFGEVRTGTVKNFTIYGEVVANTEVDYIGGVIGSVCGVNGENDLARNGAVIQNITSYVNLTAKAHGIGKIGGFVGYANHQSLIENCSWYGTFDAGIYRVDSGAGGFIGKIQENTSEVTILNCGAYGTIKTNYAGDYNNTATIYMGGFLSFTNTNAKTTLENCLFAGKFERGANLTDEAFLGAFGTVRSVNAIVNCYYLGDDGLEAVHSDSNLKPGSDNVEIRKVTAEQLKSGEIAYKLQGEQTEHVWGQNIGTDNYPVLGGEKVYYGYTSCADEVMVYSNDSSVSAANPAHVWGEGVLTRPTKTEEGYYTYTCTACGEATKTEEVERAANYADYTKALNDLRAYLDSDMLTDENKSNISQWLAMYDSDEAYSFIAGEEATVQEYIDATAYYASEFEAAIEDCLAGNHSGNGDYCEVCGEYIHTCDFTGEWEYDTGKHWKECTCGLISEEGTHTGGEATCTEKAVCETCGAFYGEVATNAHDWSNNDGICANGCGTECVHENQTGNVCEICGISLHTCDFTGEWKADSEKHWKECECGLLSEEGTHTGGEATCTEKAVCETCGNEYGEVDADNHDWSNGNGMCANCGEADPDAIASVSKNGNVIGCYTDLKEAINAVSGCTEDDKAVVKLLDNIDVGKDYIKINSGVFTFELNTKTMSGRDLVLYIIDGAAVTVQNGAINRFNSYDDYGTALAITEATASVINCAVTSDAAMSSGVSVSSLATVEIFDSTVSAGLRGLYVDYGGHVTVSGDSEITSNINSIEVFNDSTVEIRGGTIIAPEYGVYSDGSPVTISGGTIYGDIADLYADNYYYNGNPFKLICSEGKDEGPSFPDGITVAGVSLKEIVGEGFAYWQDVKMIVPEEGQNKILGNVVIKAECTHENQTGNVCEICGISLHTCDFTGEWKADADKHWKECECGLISEEAGHSWKFGECTECSYACEHSFTKYTETKAPTCTEAGMEMAPCDLGCDAVHPREIPATNHKDTLVQVEAQAPTCTEIGWDAYEYCTECDYTTYKEKEALDHDIVIDEAVAPKCDETGLTAGQHCSRCDAMTVIQEIVPATNHKDTLVQVEAQAPTCTEIGWDAYEYCTACDYTTYKEIPASHSIVTVEKKDATCTEAGYEAYEYCTACDYTTYKEIPVAGHTEETVKGYAATCTKAGLTDGVKCSVCDAVITAQQTIDQLAHKDEDGDFLCDYGCGHEYEKPAEPDTPDEPEQPEEPTDETCDHICHSENKFISFLWKIVRFFQKLFGIQQYCDCGVTHW